jgi:hypothetical protein
MMLEFKLFTVEPIQTNHKETSQRKLFTDSSNYLPDRDLTLRVSSKILIDINTSKYHLNNLDKF